MILLRATAPTLMRENETFPVRVMTLHSEGLELEKIDFKDDSTSSYITVWTKPEHFQDQKEIIFPFAYEREGDYICSIKVVFIKNEVEETKIIDLPIKVVTKENDEHFTSDNELFLHESNITMYLEEGRMSFTHLHREVKNEIMRTIKEKYQSATFDNLVNKDEFKAWSKYRVLELIYENEVRDNDDIHIQKRDSYSALAKSARNSASAVLDSDSDGMGDKDVALRPTLSMRLS